MRPSDVTDKANWGFESCDLSWASSQCPSYQPRDTDPNQ